MLEKKKHSRFGLFWRDLFYNNADRKPTASTSNILWQQVPMTLIIMIIYIYITFTILNINVSQQL